VQHDRQIVAILIERVEYFTATDIQRDLGVARQTLWRWRKAGKIPQGRRYRDRQVVFTHQEVEAIREYSNRLEPADSNESDQLKLFKSNSRNGIA
jgi:predicted DNA-binding transcriptional regulator AlpA